MNNHPLTKNKPIYHARISEQMKSRGSPEEPVYFWSRGCYLLYYATTGEENNQKPTSFTLKRGAPPTAILFILTTGTGITPQTESSISPFRCKITFFASVCSLTQRSITMADIDVTNVVVFGVIRALIRVALNQNRNAVFIRSTAFCFILTVAIYSSILYTLSILRLFRVIAL